LSIVDRVICAKTPYSRAFFLGPRGGKHSNSGGFGGPHRAEHLGQAGGVSVGSLNYSCSGKGSQILATDSDGLLKILAIGSCWVGQKETACKIPRMLLSQFLARTFYPRLPPPKSRRWKTNLILKKVTESGSWKTAWMGQTLNCHRRLRACHHLSLVGTQSERAYGWAMCSQGRV